MTATRTVADAIELLFDAPFDDFVAQRKQLAAALRAAGDVAGAREVRAAKRPSRTAWALNRVARHHPETLRSALDALAAAARAQSTADGDAMRELARAFRDRIGDVIKRCEETLQQAGAGLNVSQARRLAETLRAAIGQPGESRDRLMAGRLVDDLEVEDPFAGLPSAAPSRAVGREGKAQATAAAKTTKARERAVAQAHQKVRELEEEARQARMAAHQAETAAMRAQAEADKARRAAQATEARLANAREALKAI
jgi:hypothetical protein